MDLSRLAQNSSRSEEAKRKREEAAQGWVVRIGETRAQAWQNINHSHIQNDGMWFYNPILG